jgi:hypothetical protein
VFADADGASKFQDLRKLVSACQDVEDTTARGIAVGSRAHLVGSAAVVQVCLVLESEVARSNHLTVPSDPSSETSSCIPFTFSCES